MYLASVGPTVSVSGTGAINEGENAVFTVSTDEADTSRTEILVINLTAASDKSGTNFISGTPPPTVSIPGGATSAPYEVSTTNDNVAGNNPGLITVTLQTGDNYNLADSGTSASVGVRDNAGTRGSEVYIVRSSCNG